MNALQGEFTVACNRFDMLGLDWNPDVWVLADVAEEDPWWDWENLLQRDSTFFFRDHDRSFIEPYKRPNVVFMERCEHIGGQYVPLEWHLDSAPCEYGGGISIALQIAASMGKNPIYLLGCDLYKYRGPTDPDINHFDENYCEYKLHKGEELLPPERWENLNRRLIMGHEIAKRSADKIGVSIYNATVGGELEVFERVSVSELF